MIFNRSRSNLAAWFTLSMGSILVIFAAILYLREACERLHIFDQTLANTSQIMAGSVENFAYSEEGKIDLEHVPILGSDTFATSTDLFFARWYTPQKRLLQFTGPIPPEQLTTAPGFQTLSVPDLEVTQTIHLRQLTLPVRQDNHLIGYLQIAASLAPVEEPLHELRCFLVLGVPLALGAIALTSWILSGVAMQPIRQSYQQLQQFTADASHELRTPLAGILSHAQVGLMEPVDPQEQSDRLQTISEVAVSMSLLLAQLLFLARHEGKLLPKMLKPVDLVKLLEPVAEEYRIQAIQKKQGFSHTFPKQPLWVQAEPDLLRQAVVNLLSNAQRYTPEGGTIELRLISSSRWAIVQVQDSGIGIGAEDLPRIFDRFYRVDQARSRQTGGFGLGLAIARQTIEAHRGEITVQSKLRQGSLFEVKLPLLQKMG